MNLCPMPSRGRSGLFIASWHDLIPRYRVRRPEDCFICFTYTEPDYMLPNGTWQNGRTWDQKSVPGRWIQWLGRKWFWTETK